ncbi:MAG: Fe-S cluster assembly ATPase SufC [Acidimicrobiaceae bacterium]|nr:Fe-S cluster assembly ATPase SufC [Acidimicrobiaceae bacterium]
MSTLVIEGLRASVAGREILTGVDLEVAAGEVHAVMGPNGSGKSTLAHVIAGRGGYDVLDGSVRLDGAELLGMPAWQRAEAGLFLAMQYPTEVPGVSLLDMLTESVCTPEGAAVAEQMRSEADRIGLDEQFLQRPVNVDLSGGERKRNEALQLGVLKPAFAVMDELDSGLDVDALRLVAGRIEEATEHDGLGVLAITHYSRVFAHLRPDAVHVFTGGRIQESGGSELADELEAEGYERWTTALPQPASEAGVTPFTDPFGDPFADLLA